MKQLPDLEGWAIFAQVAACGSFSGAATELGLATTTVSKAVTRIEEKMRTVLLHRTTRKLSLTDTGARSLERARRILSEAGSIERDLGQVLAAPHGEIRVSLSSAIDGDLIIPSLADFLAQHPQITIDLAIRCDDVDLVAEGFDMALRVGSGGAQSLRMLKLFTLRHLLVASPEFLKRHGTPLTVEDLAGLPAIGRLARNDSELSLVDSRGLEKRVAMDGPLRMNNMQAMVPSLLQGLGYGSVPAFLVERLISDRALVRLLPDWQQPSLPVCMLTHSGQSRPRRLQMLIDFLRLRLARQWPPEGADLCASVGRTPANAPGLRVGRENR